MNLEVMEVQEIAVRAGEVEDQLLRRFLQRTLHLVVEAAEAISEMELPVQAAALEERLVPTAPAAVEVQERQAVMQAVQLQAPEEQEAPHKQEQMETAL
jgi:hypothetical protein